MTDVDLWTEIEGIAQIAGISEGNFHVMKSRGQLPKKWVAPVYMALGEKVPVEKIYALTETKAQ